MISAESQFPELMKRVERIVSSTFPIESKNYKMSVSNLRWVDHGPEIRDNPTLHKQHKIKEKTLAAKLVGTVSIKQKGGKIVDRSTGFTLVTLPHITNRSSYIVNGNEVQTVNQLRLRPGPYTRFTSDDNTETFINAAGGGYRVIFNRETKVFRLRSGSTYVYLYPILKAIGISDGEMRHAWGDEIFDANKKYDKPDQVARLYKSMRRYAETPEEGAQLGTAVDSFFRSKKLDPAISKLTLKEAFNEITPQVLLKSSEKAINLAAGAVEADDTESMAFKSIHSVEDFIPDRLIKAVPGLTRNIQVGMDRKPQISSLMSPATFSDPVLDWFQTSEFTRYSNQMNPLDIASTSSLTTVMGEGGIQSLHAVTDPLRAAHPSQLGILDPTHSPEGGRIGITGHLAIGATKKGNTLLTSVMDAKTGKIAQKSVPELEDAVIAFHDQYNLTTKPPRPVAIKVKARKEGRIQMVPAREVNYIFHDPKTLFSSTTNTIPFMPTDHANRILMADRHVEQAVPLVNPDRPVVQARFKGKMGYEDFFGRNMSPEAPVAGTVTRVTKNAIYIKGKDRKLYTVNLHHEYPLNGGAFLTEKSIVKKGDKVTAGQKIADNNFTKDGALALGKNLKVALLPYKGYNFEDGIVISQGAAQKLSSEHKYEFRLDISRDTVVGLKRWLAHFPDEAANVDRAKYDASGVIKKGARVEEDDVLIPAVEQVTPHEEYHYAKLHKSLRNPWVDKSEKWNNDYPGIVTDVVKTGKFIKVFVKTEEPLQIGDKLCYAVGHDVLTSKGWKSIQDLDFDDFVATLDSDGNLVYQYPTELHAYLVDEDLYSVESQQVELLVTDNHKLYIQKRNREHYELVPAKECFGKRVRHKKDAEWVGKTEETISIGRYEFRLSDFLQFLGFFIAEGNFGKVDYRIEVTQTIEEHRTWFLNLCKDLGLHAIENGEKIIIYDKGLYLWLRQVGNGAGFKQIPDGILDMSGSLLLNLWEGLHRGDGSTCSSGSEIYFTSSRRLADQVQELALKVGWSANIYTRFEAGWETVINGRETKANFDGLVVRIVKSKNQPTINHGHSKTQSGQKEEWRHYQGPVYCVTVPNHVLYVRRNGKPVWCGNSNRHGAKGIVTALIPDNEMYKDEKGNTIDMLYNPAGVPGRINPGQMLEGAAGKIADKTGKTFLSDNFHEKQNQLAMVEDGMARVGVSDEEKLYDPVNNKTLDDVYVGNIHVMKLQHQVRKKFSARGTGPNYTSDEQPSKISGESAQNIGSGELFSLLAGGATHFLKDAVTLKSQSNPEYWRAMRTGLPTPPPQQPFILDKFVNYMKGAGINVKQDGSILKTLPLTDKDVKAQSAGEITNPNVVRANDLKPEPGGLFDKGITGGVGGVHWGHIDLGTRIPNPLMERPIIAVTGLKSAQFKAIMNGTLFVAADGSLTSDPDKGLPSGEGIKRLLKKVNVNKDLRKTIKEIRGAKRNKLNELNKKRKYLQALKDSKMKPVDAYTQKKVAVIPPKFRPIYPLPSGALNIADPNHGYREVLMVNNQLKELQRMGVDNRNLAKVRADLYGAVQGLTGMTEPLTRNKAFKGFVATIKGRQNKYGMFQGRLVKRPQDLSGRSTIIPDPKLGIDEVGIPEEMAMTIYKPFVMRNLVNLGYKPREAVERIDEKDPIASRVLEEEMKDRPLYLNRAPSLHKFSMLPFKPMAVAGRAIKINPLIVSGFNADFDGNCVSFNSKISLKISENLIDSGKVGNFFKEFIMRVTGLSKITYRDDTQTTSATIGSNRYVEISCEIGEFPRIGEPMKDKNDADVYIVPPGVSVLSYDHEEGGYGFFPVSFFTVEKECPCVLLKTRSKEVEISDNESVAVFDRDSGSIVKVKPEGSEGKLVPVLREVRSYGDYGDFDIGWFYGSLVSDGWKTDGRMVGYAKNDDDKRARVLKIAREKIHENFTSHTYEGKKGENKYADSKKIHINGREFHDAVLPILAPVSREKGKRQALYKSIPTKILDEGSRECLIGVFCGLIDGDGSMSFNKAKKREQFLASYATSSPFLRWDIEQLGMKIGIRASTTVTPAKKNRNESYVITFSTPDLYRVRDELRFTGKDTQERWEKFLLNPPVKDDTDIIPLTQSESLALSKIARSNGDNSAYTTLRREKATRALILRALSYTDSEEFEALRKRCAAPVGWEVVKSVTEIGKMDVFDFCVEKTKIFAVNHGLIVYDTMGVHVPVSEEARLEAFKKLPSKQLFSSRTEGLMHTPTKEAILGLYLMTKPKGKPVKASTPQEMLAMFQRKEIKANSAVKIGRKIWTPGQAIVNDVFPDNAKPGNIVLTKSKVNKILHDFARSHPKKAGDVISKIKDLGNHYVTELGFSFSLKDLKFDYGKRDKVMSKAAIRARKVGFEKAYHEATGQLQDLVLDRKDSRIVIGGPISGAFGKGGEIRQMIASPVAVVDHKNRVVPVPIGRSFAEGQDIASYLATIPGARKGLADKGLKTADTGALSKKLINTTIEEVVSMTNCGTMNGIDMQVISRDALDRVVASGPYKGRLLDTTLQKTLKSRGVKKIKVRSPLTCEAVRGVCSKCFGLLENGKFPPVGYHVGALAGQSIGEPLTQLTLRAFHTGGALGSKAVGFERVKQLLEMPDNVPGRAIIAQAAGKITGVKPSAAGGWFVDIGETQHFVPKERGLAVKKGQIVKAGQQISQTGAVRPQDILSSTNDINLVRNQIIGDLDKEFSAGGVRVKRKLFETVVRPMTSRAEVTDAGDGEKYKIYRGDIIPVNKIIAVNKKIKRKRGRLIEFEPTLLSIRVAPYHGDDFIGKLMFERPHETLRAAPAIGATADIRSGHPITQYTFGRHFGEKKKGKR